MPLTWSQFISQPLDLFKSPSISQRWFSDLKLLMHCMWERYQSQLISGIMIPSRSKITRCFCDAKCLAKGGVGADGQPKGVQMSEVKKKMHLHWIEWESLDWAGKDLFVSTITNDHIPSLRTLNSSVRAAPNYHAPEAPPSSAFTHKETSSNNMPPLMESSDDNEDEETPIPLANHRRDHNKITKHDKQILENINKKNHHMC